MPTPDKRSHTNTIADGHMIGDADLAAQQDEIAERHAAGDAHLAGHDAMTSDARVVPDLNEIINFGSLADDVSPSAPRSIVELAPISTRSWMMTLPNCGILT